jgi:hypothetical protein
LRQELLGFFQHDAIALASAYEGAVRLLAMPGFPGRLHFIAHALRDISNVLPSIVSGGTKASHVQYYQELNKIVDDWPYDAITKGSFSDASSPQVLENGIRIPKRAYVVLNGLLQSHRAKAGAPTAIERLYYGLTKIGRMDDSELSARQITLFEKERRWFVEHAHFREMVATVSEDEINERFVRIETILHSLLGKFFTSMSALDEILRAANENTA